MISKSDEKFDDYMNRPVDYVWKEEDVIKEFEIVQDKKKVAKIFKLKVAEITKILETVTTYRVHLLDDLGNI